MRQVHEALLVALRPDSLQEDAYDAEAMAQYDMLAQAANTEDASSAGTEAGVAPAAETANPPGAGSPPDAGGPPGKQASRSEEHTSELQSLMRTSYAVFCLK